MWNYVYYAVYLDSIDISDHNAIQKYVFDSVSATLQSSLKGTCLAMLILQITAGSTDFFPQLEAISLPTEEDFTKIRLEELQCMVQVVLNKFKQKV